MPKLDKAALAAAVKLVDVKLGRVPPFNPGGVDPADYDRWRAANNQALDAIRRELWIAGARFTDRDGVSVRFHGLRASSTSGLLGALQNWMTAARKQLAEAGR